jgi:hypothetical protein
LLTDFRNTYRNYRIRMRRSSVCIPRAGRLLPISIYKCHQTAAKLTFSGAPNISSATHSVALKSSAMSASVSWNKKHSALHVLQIIVTDQLTYIIRLLVNIHKHPLVCIGSLTTTAQINEYEVKLLSLHKLSYMYAAANTMHQQYRTEWLANASAIAHLAAFFAFGTLQVTKDNQTHINLKYAKQQPSIGYKMASKAYTLFNPTRSMRHAKD